MILRSCTSAHQEAGRASPDDADFEGFGRRQSLQPRREQRVHILDRGIERNVLGPEIRAACVVDDPLEQGHVQAADRGEEELPGLRHRQIPLAGLDQSRLRRRSLDHMADDRIARLRQEAAAGKVPPAEMQRWVRVVRLRIGEKVRGELAEVHDAIRP
jgi:hypothetical protein